MVFISFVSLYSRLELFMFFFLCFRKILLNLSGLLYLDSVWYYSSKYVYNAYTVAEVTHKCTSERGKMCGFVLIASSVQGETLLRL